MEKFMEKTPDIVILGDLNLDWACTTLPFSFTDMQSNYQSWAAINEVPGGTALLAAKFAAEFEFTPLLIGKVGKDHAGSIINAELKTLNIQSAIYVHETTSTGKTFIVWDSPPNSVRLLIVDSPNANQELTIKEIEENALQIADSKFLFISGYCFLNKQSPRFNATLKAIEIANSSNKTKVVFDIVPHKIYERYSRKEYFNLLKGVDVVVSEVATIRRFLNIGNKNESLDKTKVNETIINLKEYFDNFILRYGFTGSGKQVLVKNDNIFWEDTGFSQAKDTRGFSDRLTIKALKEYFNFA